MSSGGPAGGWRAAVLAPRPGLVTALLLACVALLPAEPLFNVAIIALAAIGLARLVAGPGAMVADPGLKLLGLVFAGIWVPMALSLPDAAVPAESTRKALSFVLFYLAGVATVGALRTGADVSRLALLVTVLLFAWCVDALWQFGAGTSILGHPYTGGRVSGVFHPHLTLGIVLAALAPLVLHALAGPGRAWPWFLVLPYVAVVALSGSRSSWVSLAVIAAALVVWARVRMWRSRRIILAVVASVVVTLALVAVLAPDASHRARALIGDRAASFTDLLSGDRARIDEALAYRLTIWETAVSVGAAHWLNGVGPRGFRAVYADFASPDDFFVQSEDHEGVTHPHQIVLEIAVETGVIGVMGYALACLALAIAWMRLPARARRAAFGPALLALVALFPLNVHKGFYGNFAATLAWWAMAVAIAGIAAAGNRRPGPDDLAANCARR